MNKQVHLCFIDVSKAFDNVKHEKLIEVLRNTGIDGKIILLSLICIGVSKTKIGNSLSNEIAVRKGVRQGCIVSLLLFNLYSEEIFGKALADLLDGIKINGQAINNIRYADDAVIIVNKNEELQNIMHNIYIASEEYGLSLNISKTKHMIISKSQHPAFNNMTKLFTSKDISLQLKLRLVRCYIPSVLFYGVEAWTTTEATLNRLESFKTWTYRHILKIYWTEHITNMEVMRRLGKEKEAVFTVKKRKLEYFGHMLRHEKHRLLQLVVQGKVDSKRGTGRTFLVAQPTPVVWIVTC